MKVFHFGGQVECNSVDELVRALKFRSETNSNEFELYGNDKYPYMTVLVKGEHACVHVFKSDDDCGSYAYRKDNEMIGDGVTVFNIGDPTSETEISDAMIIPFSLAIEVARCFFETKEKSNSVEWFDL